MSLIGDLFTLGLMKVFASKEEKKKFRDTVALSNAMLDAGIDSLQRGFIKAISSSSIFPGFAEEFEKAKKKQIRR